MKSILSCLWFISIVITASAQEVSVKYGGDEVAVNQVFTITLTIENERLKNYSPFPEIDGFLKRGTSSSTSTSFINGKMTSSQSIIQNYQPTKEGTFNIPDFTIAVNGKNYEVQGTTVTVGPAAQRSQRNNSDAFDPFDFFNRRRQPSQQQEFVDVQAEAFLALTTDKKEVYVGEGFTTTLAFYVAESNRADMRFYELGKQITEIVKQIKPENCWEENFNIDNINGQPVTLNGKPYTQYKIFQAAYYPLNEEPIEFESVGLKLIKYKVAKNPSFFGRNRQEDFETFYSKPKTVEVVPLPPHPLRESVSVGTFDLTENISNKALKTGESFNYQFKVRGIGNISSVEAPRIPEDGQFDFYEPNIQQDVRRAQNLVSGTKAFNFYGIPNEPGTYNLGDYMQWIYFDPDKEQYDTLRSELVVNVSGESRKNEYISSSDLGSFYDQIQYEENALASVSGDELMKYLTNALIIVVLVILTVFRRNEIRDGFAQFVESNNIQIVKALALLIGIHVVINSALLVLPFDVELLQFFLMILMAVATIIVLGRLLFRSKRYIVAGDMFFYNFISIFIATLINGLITGSMTQYDWSNTFIFTFIGHLLFAFILIQIHALGHFFVRQGYSKWDAIIPFKNLYILCKITDKHFITELLLAFIPIVNIYYTYLLFSKVCQLQKIDDKHAIFATIFPFVAQSKIFYDNKENYARIYKFGYGK
ncbi:MAG: BatD family protein [Cytophagales bacterium]|nr:BatD family protein [Cytophagales bacterium]